MTQSAERKSLRNVSFDGPGRRFTDDQRRRILKLACEDGLGIDLIAERFSTSAVTIKDLIRRAREGRLG